MRPLTDDTPRTKALRLTMTPEIFDILQKLAGMDNVPVAFKAYQVLKQYALANQKLVEEYSALLEKIRQNNQPETFSINRQPIMTNKE